MSTVLFLAGLALGAGGALAGAALPARIRVAAAAVLTVAACVAAGTAAAAVLASGQPVSLHSAAILPLTGVDLALDPLGAVFVITTSVVGAAASIYSVGYAAHGDRARTVTALLPAFITSLLLVPAAGSVATFLAAWELMALTSLLLVLTGHHRPEARQAATWYAAMTQIGAALILVALVLTSVRAGSQSFAVIAARAGGIPLPARSLAFVLALAGFAAKAGAVPVHVWLPRAHPAAPGPVSALMSGAMINLGIYGIVRTGAGLLGGGVLWWWLAVAGLGVATALFGALHAAAGTDLKRLLAYSTVDNAGLMLIGVGAAGALLTTGHPRPAFLLLVAALLQLVNHSAVKGCLFLAAGSVQHAAGTRDLDRLGGLARRMPVTATLFAVGALSMSALPPLGGFASEWLLLQGLLRGLAAPGAATAIALLAGAAALALTGGLTAAAFVKALGVGFLGQPRTTPAARAREVSWTMLAGPALLAVPGVLLGVLPGVAVPLLSRAAGAALGHLPPAPVRAGLGLAVTSTANVIQPALLAVALIAALAGAAGLLRIRSRAVARRITARSGAPAAALRCAEPWGCGGGPLTPRMAITATSFAEPLQRVFGDVLRPARDLDVSHAADSRYFVNAISFRSRVDDAIEGSAYRPLIRLAWRWGELARRAQNGSVHRYLGYGFAALVALLVLLS